MGVEATMPWILILAFFPVINSLPENAPMAGGGIAAVAGDAFGFCAFAALQFAGQIRLPEQRPGQGQKLNIRFVQHPFHFVDAAQTAFDDGIILSDLPADQVDLPDDPGTFLESADQRDLLFRRLIQVRRFGLTVERIGEPDGIFGCGGNTVGFLIRFEFLVHHSPRFLLMIRTQYACVFNKYY